MESGASYVCDALHEITIEWVRLTSVSVADARCAPAKRLSWGGQGVRHYTLVTYECLKTCTTCPPAIAIWINTERKG